MALAGRCPCGVRLDLAADEPEVHLVCRGEKRCLQCERVKPTSDFYRGGGGGINGNCKACHKANRIKRFREQYQQDEEFREAHRVRVKLYKVLGPKTGIRRGRQNRQLPLERTCVECHLTKHIDKFRTYKRLRLRCVECFPAHQKRLNEANPYYQANHKAWSRDWWRRNRSKNEEWAA